MFGYVVLVLISLAILWYVIDTISFKMKTKCKTYSGDHHWHLIRAENVEWYSDNCEKHHGRTVIVGRQTIKKCCKCGLVKIRTAKDICYPEIEYYRDARK